MGATQDGPGISIQALMGEADLAFVRRLLGEPVVALLDLLAGGSASAEHLRGVAAATCDFEQLLAEPTHRSALIALLDEGKQRELVFRLGLSESTDPARALRSMTWTKDCLRQLFGFFGLVVDRSIMEPSPARRTTRPGYGLFPHQRSAVQRMTPLLAGGRRRGVLHLPTGVGKTRTAMSMICDHLRRQGPAVVVWLAHGRELLEQAALEFEQAWACLGDREVTVARMFGPGPVSLDGLHDGLVVLGVEKGVPADLLSAPAGSVGERVGEDGIGRTVEGPRRRGQCDDDQLHQRGGPRSVPHLRQRALRRAVEPCPRGGCAGRAEPSRLVVPPASCR